MWHTRKNRQHLASLIRIIVDGLLAENHQTRLFFFNNVLEELGDSQRLQQFVSLEQNTSVSSHGKCCANGLLTLAGPDGYRDNLIRVACFFDTKRFFDRDFVKRVHRHLDVRELNAGFVRLDASLDVVVKHAFDTYDNFHGIPLELISGILRQNGTR